MPNQTKQIPLKKLILWDENARFPDKYFNRDEIDLIDYFLSKKDFKIRDLIKAIVKDFDLPQLEKLVVWNNGTQNIVLEGNRRLTALKLLNNNVLAKNIKLREFLAGEKNKIKISDDYKIECVLVESKEDAFRYLDRKHYQGNNEVAWKDTERALYNKRRGGGNTTELIKIGIAKIVRNLDIPYEMKERVLGAGYVTTLYRILTTNPAKKEFKYSLDDKGNLIVGDLEFKEKLKIIIYSVLNKEDLKGNKIDSRTLNKRENVVKFIRSIEANESKKVDSKIKENSTVDIFGNESFALENKPSKPKLFPTSTSRKYLIPMSCILSIKVPKINSVYRELREKLLLDESNKSVPNAVGVLFRVFLEISLDYYAEMNQNIFKKDTNISAKIPWVVNHLKNKGYKHEKFKNINKVGSASGLISYLSIENFHEYVHSSTTQPSQMDLKIKWDNLQWFFETLWCELNKK